MKDRPKIVCLCGSTKFRHIFEKINEELTLDGFIVLSPGVWLHQMVNRYGTNGSDWIEKKITDDQKIKLGELHKIKIDIADEIFIINAGRYIGESTQSEINYAIAHNKPVRYLEKINI